MVKIIVGKETLEKKLSQAKDGSFIELAIVPAQNDCGNHAPAFLHFTVIHSNGACEDLESIDECIAEFCVKETA
ncbi:MAG: hypothetical protein ACOX0K_07580 [Oscillospiraceae bacterium]